MSTTTLVGRIAHTTSSTLIVSSQSAYTLPSSSTQSPRIETLPPHADPGLIASRSASDASLISILLDSDSAFTRLVPSLTSLGSSPCVVHVALPKGADLSDLVALRSSGWAILLSTSAQDAHDHAIIASKYARHCSKAVLHVFTKLDEAELSFEELEEAPLREFVEAELPVPATVNVNATLSESFKSFERASLSTLALLRRPQRPYVYTGPSTTSTVFVVFGTDASTLVDLASSSSAHFGVLEVRVLRPFAPSRLLAAFPEGVKNIVVLEQSFRKTTKWGGLYLDIAAAFSDEENSPHVHGGVIGALPNAHLLESEVTNIITRLGSSQDLVLGSLPSTATSTEATIPQVPELESAYTKMLSQIFNTRLEISNAPALIPSEGPSATLPEYALGKVRSDLAKREELVEAVKALINTYGVSQSVHSAFAKWLLAKDDASTAQSVAQAAIAALKVDDAASSKAGKKILELQALAKPVSRWIIGSDAWSYDLGASGVHHAIASGENVNLLLIDSVPYTERDAAEAHRRKKDVGLYAMNHGDVYVASVAVYSSYSQVLQALHEADQFNGPSVVLAYLPYAEETASPLSVLKETKLAVDTGYWPLYRWNPSLEAVGKEPFSLDSERIKNELQEFLDRQSHLSQLTNAQPTLAPELVGSLGEKLLVARKDKAKAAYEKLLSAFDGPPLLILFASDGGAAEKMAKRLAMRAGLRGLAARCIPMDNFPLDDLKLESHVAIVTSTAGQGESPQNSRATVKALSAFSAKGEQIFTSDLKYSVFGLGDSHYWPRPEDAHYYNKAGKDLDARFAELGAERMAPLGLGDDQDADGPQTGYKVWEPLLWKAMGVDGIEVLEAEPEPITNEHIKISSNYLRGTIAEGLVDTSTGALDASDGQLTKFHGIYQQDDRDIREERTAAGLEPAYSFMVRVRLPAGVATPAQWLAMDHISDAHGNGTLKMTTRQTWQYHGIIKKHLKPAIQAINRALLDTIAACGDVNRNVQCAANPSMSHLHKEVWQFSKDLSEHLLPNTSAYAEIWLDKKKVAGDAVQDFEPMYGKYYLPRKFKIAVCLPPHNDVDVYTNDVGFIGIVNKASEKIVGYNVTVGGGMGVTHSNTKTYPRLGDVIGFVTPEQGCAVAEAIMLAQRDHGNRADRKNARLKYTVDRLGLEGFKAEVEKRLGYKLQPERPYKFDSSIDKFGWSQGADGNHHFTMFIENGRVQDEPNLQFKTGLREIAKVHKGFFRLTANQHLILSDIPTENLPEIKALLSKYKLDNLNFSALRLSSSACVALPTCGLAMAESERYLPVLVSKVEAIMEENGLRNDSIVMRMSGCPNGCSRPWPAEIAFVGKAPGQYQMLLGGGFHGQRLSKIYRESIDEVEILAILRPLIKRYALERHEGEHFGDFVIRIGVIMPTTSGKTFYEHTSMHTPTAIAV